MYMFTADNVVCSFSPVYANVDIVHSLTTYYNIYNICIMHVCECAQIHTNLFFIDDLQHNKTHSTKSCAWLIRTCLALARILAIIRHITIYCQFLSLCY